MNKSVRKTDYCDNECIIHHSRLCERKRNLAKVTRWRSKNPEYYSGYVAKWLRNNSQKQKDYKKLRRDTDPVFKLALYLRTYLAVAIRKNQKRSSVEPHLGCSLTEFKIYIESKFEPDMTWDNWGNKKGMWSFDHIIPFSQARTKEEVYKLFHFSNVRPMWYIENLRKGRKKDGEKSYQVKK